MYNLAQTQTTLLLLRQALGLDQKLVCGALVVAVVAVVSEHCGWCLTLLYVMLLTYASHCLCILTRPSHFIEHFEASFWKELQREVCQERFARAFSPGSTLPRMLRISSLIDRPLFASSTDEPGQNIENTLD
jgi:hypothetical protein